MACAAGRVDIALPAIERWADGPIEGGLLQIVRHAILREKPSDKRRTNEDQLLRLVGANRWNVDGDASGIAHYNCGNLLRSFDRHEEAISEYEAAASRYAAYSERDYFWRELAGSLFLLTKYHESSKAYRRAIESGDDSVLVRNLMADSLIGAGEYAESLRIVDGRSDEGGGILTAIVARHVVERFAIFAQRRQPEEAQRYVETTGDGAADPSTLAGLDALNPNCWLLHSLEDITSDQELAERMIVMARVADSEPSLWASALVFAVLADLHEDLLFAIVRRAEQQTGGNFVTEVANMVESLDITREAKDRLLDLSETTFENPDEKAITIRDGQTGNEIQTD